MQILRCSECNLEVGTRVSESGVVFTNDLVFSESTNRPTILKGHCSACGSTLAYKSLDTGELLLREDRVILQLSASESVLAEYVSLKRKGG